MVNLTNQKHQNHDKFDFGGVANYFILFYYFFVWFKPTKIMKNVDFFSIANNKKLKKYVQGPLKVNKAIFMILHMIYKNANNDFRRIL